MQALAGYYFRRMKIVIMLMKDYLIDSFLFNDAMNRQMLKKISSLNDKENCIRHVSHLINSQNKWMARIMQDENAPQMSWWDPVYSLEELEQQWEDSLHSWVGFLKTKTEEEILSDTIFTGYDGGKWKAKLSDIALQLNYHSIHHRAQMQMMIRQQGVEPDFIDYIGTKYTKLS